MVYMRSVGSGGDYLDLLFAKVFSMGELALGKDIQKFV